MMPLPWVFVFFLIFLCFFCVCLLVSFFYIPSGSELQSYSGIYSKGCEIPW